MPTVPIALLNRPLVTAPKAPLITLTPARIRGLILAALAILCAAAIGIGVTQLLFL
jgi:hypothetical protein